MQQINTTVTTIDDIDTDGGGDNMYMQTLLVLLSSPLLARPTPAIASHDSRHARRENNQYTIQVYNTSFFGFFWGFFGGFFNKYYTTIINTTYCVLYCIASVMKKMCNMCNANNRETCTFLQVRFKTCLYLVFQFISNYQFLYSVA